MENQTIEEKFVEQLRESDTWIYYNLFSILLLTNPDFLQHVVEEFKNHPDDWFRVFHKSFRQWDVFNSDKLRIVKPAISDKEIAYRKELGTFRRDYRNSDNFDENNEEYVKKGKALFALNYKLHTLKIAIDEGEIGGHLDSILWQTISNDSKGVLYEFMDKFLKINVK